jgi:hypothetical protein
MKLDILCYRQLNLASCKNNFSQAKLYRNIEGHVLIAKFDMFRTLSWFSLAHQLVG